MPPLHSVQHVLVDRPFGEFLRELRRAARLTQEELAERAHVGVRTLRDLETGRANRPQRSTVDLLASALELVGVDRDDFMVAARGRPSLVRPRPAPERAPVHLRPAPTLIGRDEAVRGVSALLEVVDLVTLVGLSGVGKSSLALGIGHHVADRFPGGVGGVTVAQTSTEAEVLASLAAALGLVQVADLPARLAQRRTLLVLMGVQNSPDAARAAVRQLRRPGTDVRVLATSTHPLGLDGEHEWPVLPLDVPPASATGAEVFGYAATVLFLERLRLVRSRPVGLDEAGTLAALVRRLGGVPVALELAAARGRVLELGEILDRLAPPAAPS